MNELSVISAFTGAGGLDLGLEAAGFDLRLYIEQDLCCRATLLANRPNWKSSSVTDATAVSSDELRREGNLGTSAPLLLVGGPPCQPFSKSALWVSGSTSRLADHRANTLRAFFRLVDELKPNVFLLENVAALSSKTNTDVLDFCRSQLCQTNAAHGTNYELQVVTLRASDYGVPQHRERTFLVAHVDGRTINVPDPTHGPRSSTGTPFITAAITVDTRRSELSLAHC